MWSATYRTDLSGFLQILLDLLQTICSLSCVISTHLVSFLHGFVLLCAALWFVCTQLSEAWSDFLFMFGFFFSVFVHAFIVWCVYFIMPYVLFISFVSVISVYVLIILFWHFVPEVLFCWYQCHSHLSCSPCHYLSLLCIFCRIANMASVTMLHNCPMHTEPTILSLDS